MKIKPFGFEECLAYFANMSDEDKALMYGIVGGTPQYVLQMSDKLTLEDNMFYFWYRFVFGNVSAIARGATDVIYKKIEPQLSDYMGKIFEEICSQYLWKQLIEGKSPVEFVSLGRWWGTNPKKRQQAEIDIMGEQDSDTALFAECKWRNENVDLDVLQTLVERSNIFHYKKVHYFVFFKSSFTKECMEKAKEMGNVTLVSYRDILTNINSSTIPGA